MPCNIEKALYLLPWLANLIVELVNAAIEYPIFVITLGYHQQYSSSIGYGYQT